jgi:uncharacterized membrane protein
MSTLSTTENRVLMTQARNSLKGQWGTAVCAFIVYLFIFIILQVIIEVDTSGFFAIGSLIIYGPLVLGLSMFALSLSRQGEAKVSQIFDGFNRFGAALGAFFLLTIIVLLGYILLIVPGIIATYAVAMTYFVIADDPNIGAWGAIKRSNELMRGKKWKYFCLFLRFIGWFILSILTLGFGFLWVVPYIMVSSAKFYDDIVQKEASIIKATEIAHEPALTESSPLVETGEIIVDHPVPITLNIENGRRAGSFFAVSSSSRIGRAPDNDIVLNVDTVSSYHAEIIVKDNRFFIKDLDSTNGTKINGIRVTESVLELGDKLQIGETELSIQ